MLKEGGETMGFPVSHPGGVYAVLDTPRAMGALSVMLCRVDNDGVTERIFFVATRNIRRSKFPSPDLFLACVCEDLLFREETLQSELLKLLVGSLVSSSRRESSALCDAQEAGETVAVDVVPSDVVSFCVSNRPTVVVDVFISFFPCKAEDDTRSRLPTVKRSVEEVREERCGGVRSGGDTAFVLPTVPFPVEGGTGLCVLLVVRGEVCDSPRLVGRSGSCTTVFVSLSNTSPLSLSLFLKRIVLPLLVASTSPSLVGLLVQVFVSFGT